MKKQKTMLKTYSESNVQKETDDWILFSNFMIIQCVYNYNTQGLILYAK